VLPAGVLFDFSGTLFHLEPAADLLRATLGEQFVHLAPQLLRLGAINGSDLAAGLSPVDPALWHRRDLDAAAHRAAYSGQAIHGGLTAGQAALLYDRGVSAEAWLPYPDTVEALHGLHGRGVPVAVVSNIGWDPRPVLRRHGVLDSVDVLVLSDERGVLKPDPAIFGMACDELGAAPAHCVMVGDNPVNDGGSAAAGIRFVEVAADPQLRGPHDLLRAVGLDA
jgi:HAD superfamily hydrolase (TIGR01509 family)